MLCYPPLNFWHLLTVDDSSGATIELVLTHQEHRDMFPKADYEEYQERLWKRTMKPGNIYIGSLIKVKGEIQETWQMRKIHVMKLGTVIFCQC